MTAGAQARDHVVGDGAGEARAGAGRAAAGAQGSWQNALACWTAMPHRRSRAGHRSLGAGPSCFSCLLVSAVLHKPPHPPQLAACSRPASRLPHPLNPCHLIS